MNASAPHLSMANASTVANIVLALFTLLLANFSQLSHLYSRRILSHRTEGYGETSLETKLGV